jgi:hypothetical protein
MRLLFDLKEANFVKSMSSKYCARAPERELLTVYDLVACLLPYSATACPGYEKGNACLNCGLLGHAYGRCPDPKPAALPAPPSTSTCRRCTGGHHHTQCPLPWCRPCQTTDHGGDTCLKTACWKCKQTGHKADNPICPSFQNCKLCGGKQVTKACTVKNTCAVALAQTFEDNELTVRLFEIEKQSHLKEHPEEHINDINANATDTEGDDNNADGTETAPVSSVLLSNFLYVTRGLR